MSKICVGPSDTRYLSREPKELYGRAGAPIILRIGNGGAGPTGLLRELAERFLAKTRYPGRIAWFQDISVNTLAQLRYKIIDVALVYERIPAMDAVRQGYADHGALIFNDHFVVVGPKHNPAMLTANTGIAEAFTQIARAGAALGDTAVFLSRDDASGTNIRERHIWQHCALTPWIDAAWYLKRPYFPHIALLEADAQAMYTLSDFGTYLSILDRLRNSTVYVQGGGILRNPCRILLQNQPHSVALAFHAFLRSAEGQACIAQFGVERFGRALFTQARQREFSSTANACA